MLPTQADLDALLAGAKRIRIVDAGTSNGKLCDFTSRGQGTLKTLLELTAAPDIEAFKSVFRIATPEQGYHCMCRGWPAVEVSCGLFRTRRFGLHHAVGVRFDGWVSDAPLADGRALADWLAGRGVRELVEDLDKQDRDAAEWKIQLDRWYAAMPRCLVPFEREIVELSWGREDDVLALATAAIDAAYPEASERVMPLLRWFGSGAGPWSGFPAYEMRAAQLLAAIPAVDMWTVAAARAATDAELAGTARYVEEVARGAKQPITLPEVLREKLVAFMARHPIEDCKQRFAAAIG